MTPHRTDPVSAFRRHTAAHPGRPHGETHDLPDPDPYCGGDDPCTCIALTAARQQALEVAVERLTRTALAEHRPDRAAGLDAAITTLVQARQELA